MRILHINATAGVGSTGRLVGDICEELQRTGDQAFLAYSVGEGGPADFRAGGRLTAMAHALEARVTGIQGHGSRFDTARLNAWIRQINPDIVHLHNLHSNFVNLPALFRGFESRNQRIAVTMHDCWLMTGKCTHYDAVGCDRWKHRCGSCPQLRDDIPSWFFDFTSKMRLEKEDWFRTVGPIAAVGVSNWVTSQINESHLKHAALIRRIYNWVDSENFYPDELSAVEFRTQHGIRANEKVVLGVADRWTIWKGLGRLTEMAALLPVGVRMVVIGEVPSTATIPSGVVHIPRTSSIGEVRGAYNAAHVYVSTSVQETFGLTVVEALMCGTPAVVMNRTASPELINENDGAVVSPDSPEALLCETMKFLNLASSNTSGRSLRAKERFARSRGVSEYLSLYQDLLAVHDSA